MYPGNKYIKQCTLYVYLSHFLNTIRMKSKIHTVVPNSTITYLKLINGVEKDSL